MTSPAMRSAVVAAGVTIALAAGAWQQSEAPTGFDDRTNGVIDDSTHKVDGVRLRPRLMHDQASLTLRDAIVRHGGEASGVTQRFRTLSHREQEAIIEFLKSL